MVESKRHFAFMDATREYIGGARQAGDVLFGQELYVSEQHRLRQGDDMTHFGARKLTEDGFPHIGDHAAVRIKCDRLNSKAPIMMVRTGRDQLTISERSNLIDPQLSEMLDKRPALEALWRSDRGLTADTLLTGLNRFLTENAGGARASDLRRLAGGGTNKLFSFIFEQGDESRKLILRIKSPGATVITHIAREFQGMGVGGTVMPVPAPIFLIENPTYFGAQALICAFAAGVQAPPQEAQKMSGMGTRYDPAQRLELGRQFVTYQARLHAMDLDPVELSRFTIPLDGTTGAVDQRLAFWDRIWEIDKLEDHPVLTMTREWLWRNRPQVDRVSLLHGDYRNGNFLFDPETARITAVIDWEMCALGDRHYDLAYTMFRSFGHDNDNGEFLIAGLLTMSDFIAIYETESGLKIDRDRLRYYGVFNMYWSNIALIATALRGVEKGLSDIDVMYNVMAAKGVLSWEALLAIIGRNV